ncbi:hypothetical protein AXX17_AT2G11430 [Arabidopsis thaliana]|nr:hypothetical protein AXX17_AT2G11430 [Arabidopsis thaliana]
MCQHENGGVPCDNCKAYCRKSYVGPDDYGRCVGLYGFRTCTCYYECSNWPSSFLS